MEETNNQFESQGVSIKNLEIQIEQIAYAPSSRTIRALPSSTESPTSTSKTKSVEIFKVIF